MPKLPSTRRITWPNGSVLTSSPPGLTTIAPTYHPGCPAAHPSRRPPSSSIRRGRAQGGALLITSPCSGPGRLSTSRATPSRLLAMRDFWVPTDTGLMRCAHWISFRTPTTLRWLPGLFGRVEREPTAPLGAPGPGPADRASVRAARTTAVVAAVSSVLSRVVTNRIDVVSCVAGSWEISWAVTVEYFRAFSRAGLPALCAGPAAPSARLLGWRLVR